jgi:hypothetical protein
MSDERRKDQSEKPLLCGDIKVDVDALLQALSGQVGNAGDTLGLILKPQEYRITGRCHVCRQYEGQALAALPYLGGSHPKLFDLRIL